MATLKKLENNPTKEHQPEVCQGLAVFFQPLAALDGQMGSMLQ